MRKYGTPLLGHSAQPSWRGRSALRESHQHSGGRKRDSENFGDKARKYCPRHLVIGGFEFLKLACTRERNGLLRRRGRSGPLRFYKINEVAKTWAYECSREVSQQAADSCCDECCYGNREQPPTCSRKVGEYFAADPELGKCDEQRHKRARRRNHCHASRLQRAAAFVLLSEARYHKGRIDTSCTSIGVA